MPHIQPLFQSSPLLLHMAAGSSPLHASKARLNTALQLRMAASMLIACSAHLDGVIERGLGAGLDLRWGGLVMHRVFPLVLVLIEPENISICMQCSVSPADVQVTVGTYLAQIPDRKNAAGAIDGAIEGVFGTRRFDASENGELPRGGGCDRAAGCRQERMSAAR